MTMLEEKLADLGSRLEYAAHASKVAGSGVIMTPDQALEIAQRLMDASVEIRALKSRSEA